MPPNFPFKEIIFHYMLEMLPTERPSIQRRPFFTFFFNKVKMIYNAVLISADSKMIVTHMHTHKKNI